MFSGRAVSAPVTRHNQINLDDALNSIRGNSQLQQYNVGDSGAMFLQVKPLCNLLCLLLNRYVDSSFFFLPQKIGFNSIGGKSLRMFVIRFTIGWIDQSTAEKIMKMAYLF